jgi:hypothetical protein
MRNRFHSLCPYFAMFPEAFADRWIDQLTRRNDVVLDPLSGRGTTATCGVLKGRRAVATDVNDVAFCLTRAKTSPPAISALRRRFTQLERGFDGRQWRHALDRCPEFFHHAFSRKTLQQLLYLRSKLAWTRRATDGMIAALVLGSLHGEMDRSSSYLSNQMPRTISTKPAYSVRFWRKRKLYAPERDTFEVLRSRAAFRYESEPPRGEVVVIHRDMRELPRFVNQFPGPIRCVITSPPYFDVTNFEEDQWLRLWFLGGPPYPTTGRISRDDRHGFEDNYWRFIGDMWRSLGRVVSRTGHVVVRIGSGRIAPKEIEAMLTATSRFSQRKVKLIETEVSKIRNRQTDVFRPGSKGCVVEVDCHYQFQS